MNRLTAKESLPIRYGLFNDEERKSLGYPTSDEIYNKLKEYEDAEEQGQRVKLPCKAGDKVYVIEEIFPSNRSLYKRRIKEIDISSIEFFLNEIFIHDYDGIEYLIGEIFFTRKEAEVALEKMKDSESELV